MTPWTNKCVIYWVKGTYNLLIVFNKNVRELNAIQDYCDLCPLHRYPSFAQSTKEGKRKLLLPHAWDKKNLGIISRSAAITEYPVKKWSKACIMSFVWTHFLLLVRIARTWVPGSCRSSLSISHFFRSCCWLANPQRLGCANKDLG